MTLERFPDFVDLTSAFLFLAFLPDPTGAVTLPAAVFSLPLWSGAGNTDRAVELSGDVFTEFVVIGVRLVEVVIAPLEDGPMDGTCNDGITKDEVPEDGISEGGISEGGTSEGGISEGGISEGGISEGGIIEGGIVEGGISEDGVSKGGNTKDGVIEDGTAEDRTAEEGTTGDGATKDGVTAKDGDVGKRVAEFGISNNGEDGLSKDGMWVSKGGFCEGVIEETGRNGKYNPDASSTACDRFSSQPSEHACLDRPAPSVEGH